MAQTTTEPIPHGEQDSMGNASSNSFQEWVVLEGLSQYSGVRGELSRETVKGPESLLIMVLKVWRMACQCSEALSTVLPKHTPISSISLR
jgi:hypothetical protein